MAKRSWEEILKLERPILLDGATGTNLMKEGLPAGACTEAWLLEHGEVLTRLQQAYVAAGSDIVYAPTFGGNRIKLAGYGQEDRVEEINTRLVALSRTAVGDQALVAGDLTMTGKQLAPMGDLAFETLIETYKEQIRILEAAGVDLLVVETMMSLQECRAALIAAAETTKLPVMVSLTFEADGRTLYGTDARTAAVVCASLGAAAVGANCSTGPDRMRGIIADMAAVTTIPIIAKPNAGMPTVNAEGETIYDMDATHFVQEMSILLDAGARIIGGCCGTTPAYISGLKQQYGERHPGNVARRPEGIRYLTSERRTLSFGLGDPFLIVGERINPTGKKRLQAELKEGRLDLVAEYAQTQEAEGASILDINVGMSGIDEGTMMQQVMDEVLQLTDLPLCIDTSDPDIMEAALRRYPGRALINSISMEPGKAERLLPVARKYGAMFILLPLGPGGLPKNLEERLSHIRQLSQAAEKEGLNREDIVVDGLVATVGAEPEAANDCLDTIAWCRAHGFATTCGLSNISFGLPQRSFINTAFLTMAIDRGLTMAISNPSQEMLVNAAFASDLLRHKEGADLRYIERMSRYEGTAQVVIGEASQTVRKAAAAPADTAPAANAAPTNDAAQRLHQDVLKGNRRNIEADTRAALDAGCPAQSLLNDTLMPAINEVGELFDQGRYFLPQLIASAEAMKQSIAILEPVLAQDRAQTDATPATVIIATVKGDIHDIGKNLVSLMLRNVGYRVIDLGKDVPAETIIQTAVEEDAAIIALSALMTTTMQEMRHVVQLARERQVRAKIIIGGAVVTREYAEEIGADDYSSDAADAVRVVRRLLQE
ncbi:MAG: homocysteine S-methyltransferase family protein [Butyrivibrio sp.]|nr:homocysteine S-methyltransferase family protein [Butyrivibrio sp.]